MVAVAQLVRAPLCGSGGCRFKSGQPPQLNKGANYIAQGAKIDENKKPSNI